MTPQAFQTQEQMMINIQRNWVDKGLQLSSYVIIKSATSYLR